MVYFKGSYHNDKKIAGENLLKWLCGPLIGGNTSENHQLSGM